MQEIDKKIRNNFIIALGVNLIVLAVFLVLLYFAGRVGNSEMERSVTALHKLENMQSNYSVYNRAIRETEGVRNILDSYIVNKKTVSTLIGMIEGFAQYSGVSITKTVSVEKQTTLPKESMLRFGVRARGGVDDIFYFMTLLENIPYKFRFKSLAVGASEEGVRSDLMSVSSGLKNSSGGKKSVWAGEAVFEILSYINE